MEKIRLNIEGGTSLLIMGGSMSDINKLLPEADLYIITDSNVRSYYGSFFPAGTVLEIEPGEKSKTLETVGKLCSRMLEKGADRSSFILGFGGGVVCDIAGMVASVYMRGVRHAFVSTTLLSQVDASIGGKTGVNLGEYKNMLGTFKQPEFVLCDHNTLSTLPDEQFLSGMGELIKHAVIKDRNLFFDISSSLDHIFERDASLLGELISRAVKIKATVVKRDPTEKGIRRILNFGHTFGHVIETAYKIPHGIAVMQGMLIAAELSVWAGEMPYAEMKMLEVVLAETGIGRDYPLPSNIIALISKDKKSVSGCINTVLLRSIGKSMIKKLSLSELETFVNYYNEKTKGDHSE